MSKINQIRLGLLATVLLFVIGGTLFLSKRPSADEVANVDCPIVVPLTFSVNLPTKTLTKITQKPISHRICPSPLVINGVPEPTNAKIQVSLEPAQDVTIGDNGLITRDPPTILHTENTNFSTEVIHEDFSDNGSIQGSIEVLDEGTISLRLPIEIYEPNNNLLVQLISLENNLLIAEGIF